MSELSEYFNVEENERGDYHLDGTLNLILQQKVQKYYTVDPMSTCSCIKIIKFGLLVLLGFGFGLTAVFLVLFSAVMEFSIMSSVVLTGVRDDVSNGAKFFYTLYALWLATFPLYIFAILTGYVGELALVCLTRKKELPPFSVFFPESQKIWHRWNEPIRFGSIMFLIFIICIVIFSHQ